MNFIAHIFCGVKDKKSINENRERIKSIIREEHDLPDSGQLFLHVGFLGTSDISNHAVIFLESRDKDGNRKVRKIDLVHQSEGNSSSGNISGNPVMIRAFDVTGKNDGGEEEWKLKLDLLSQPLRITKNQEKKFLKRLGEEVEKDNKLYNMSGDGSSYQSVFSGADYDSCISFVTKLLVEAGIVKEGTSLKWDQAVSLPGCLMSKVPMIEPKHLRKQNFDLKKEVNELKAKEKEREEEIRRLQEQLENRNDASLGTTAIAQPNNVDLTILDTRA